MRNKRFDECCLKNLLCVAKDEGDIGCVPELMLKVNLKNETSVQKSYNSIPKPLSNEVKDYVQKLDKEIKVVILITSGMYHFSLSFFTINSVTLAFYHFVLFLHYFRFHTLFVRLDISVF